MANGDKGRIVVLDGLRLIAALMVAFYHYAGRVDVVEKAWGVSPAVAVSRSHHLAQYGWLGVELLFAVLLWRGSPWNAPCGSATAGCWPR